LLGKIIQIQNEIAIEIEGPWPENTKGSTFSSLESAILSRLGGRDYQVEEGNSPSGVDFDPDEQSHWTLILLSFALAVGLASSAYGQFALSVNFNFGGEPGDQESTAGTSNSAGVTGAVVERGPGIGATTVGNSISSNGWDGPNPATDFFSFKFTVQPGFSANITNLKIGTRASNAGPGDLALRYSGDGFLSDLFVFTQSGTAFLNSNITLNLIDLTGEVEFRIIARSDTRADGSTGITGDGTFRVVNFFQGGDTGGTTFSGTIIPNRPPTR
jgi:hypothetical protein